MPERGRNDLSALDTHCPKMDTYNVTKKVGSRRIYIDDNLFRYLDVEIGDTIAIVPTRDMGKKCLIIKKVEVAP